MLAVLKSWLLVNAARLLGFALAAASVSAVIFGIRQSGRNAERVDNLKHSLQVKHEQLRAAANAPHSRSDLIKQLRDGKF